MTETKTKKTINVTIELEIEPAEYEDGEIVNYENATILSILVDGQPPKKYSSRFEHIWTIFELKGEGYHWSLDLSEGDN
jgi:hypothetical protein